MRLSVVDIFHKYREGRLPCAGLREQDLWDEISFLCSDLPKNTFVIQWMPSHCSEDGNEAKLRKYVNLGIISDEDVKGNDMAEVLAKAGADLHVSIDHFFNAAADRRRVAIAVQKMYLMIWDAHINASDAATQAADEADIAEVERMMLAAQQDSIYDDDYDPFAEEDDDEPFAEFHDAAVDPSPTPAPLDSDEDPRTRFLECGSKDIPMMLSVPTSPMPTRSMAMEALPSLGSEALTQPRRM